MLPVLFELPLPAVRVPIGPALAVLGVVLALGLGLSVKRGTKLRVALAAGAPLLVLAAVFWNRAPALRALPVSAFGAMLALGFSSGALTVLAFGARFGIPRPRTVAALAGAAVGALLGGRALYVMVSPGVPLDRALAIGEGGLSAYGALAGAGLVVALWARRSGVPRALDLFAVGAAAVIPFAKVGCYLDGCDFGRLLGADAPEWLKRLGTFPRWPSVAFGAGSPAWWQHAQQDLIDAAAAASLPVHPAELYEAGLGLVLYYFVATALDRRARAGSVFALFAWGYAALRATTELVRGDLDRGLFGSELDARLQGVLVVGVLGLSGALGPLRGLPKQLRWGRHASDRSAAVGAGLLLGTLGSAFVLSIQADARSAPSVSLLLALVSAVLAAWFSRAHTARPALS